MILQYVRNVTIVELILGGMLIFGVALHILNELVRFRDWTLMTRNLRALNPEREVTIKFFGLLWVIKQIVAIMVVALVMLTFPLYRLWGGLPPDLSNSYESRRPGRTITSEQATIFKEALSGAVMSMPVQLMVSVELGSEGGCMECVDYSNKIADLLRGTRGINITGETATIIGPHLRENGLIIRVADQPSHSVAALFASLSAAKIRFVRLATPGFRPDEMLMMVVHPVREGCWRANPTRNMAD